MKENTVLSNIRRGFGGVASALVAIAVITLAGASEAATEKVGDYTWTYDIYGDTVVIQKDGASTAVSPKPNGSLTIPSSLGGKSKIQLGARALRNCTGLNTVTMPASVTNIHAYAFDGCSGLKSFTVANDNAYYKAVSGLLLTKDGKKLVHGVTGSVTIPSNVTSIGAGAFDSMSGLTSVTIPSGVTSIGAYAFNGCSGLKSVTIPSGVTTITPYAFFSCSGLTSVTIPDSVTHIGMQAFYNCRSLTNVTIPDSVTSIEENAFSCCDVLKSVLLPGHLEGKIDSSVFAGCNSKLEVTYRDTPVYTVANGSLTKVTNPGNATRVIVPDGVTRIEQYAFSQVGANVAELVTHVTIPSSVTYIDTEAFTGCNKIMAFEVAYNNPNYKSVNGLLLTKDGKKLVKGVKGAVTIPSGVTTIGENAFSSMHTLSSVMIPSSVTTIGSSAFYYCTGLASVTIPSGVTSIGTYAFAGCSGLRNVVVPDSVTTIGDYAFYKCSGLETASLPERFSGSLASHVFSGCSSALVVTYRNIPTFTIENGTLEKVVLNGATSVTVPSGVTSIGVQAFYKLKTLKSVTIPANVTKIDATAFDYCSALESFSVASGNPNYKSVGGLLLTQDGKTLVHAVKGTTAVPAGVTEIGRSAFSGLSDLTSVTIPESVTTLRGYAFEFCTGLKTVSLPRHLKGTFADTVFEGCPSDLALNYYGPDFTIENGTLKKVVLNGATSITIPSTVKTIGEGAFKNLTTLKSVTIPANVTNIHMYAFDGCSGLKSFAVASNSAYYKAVSGLLLTKDGKTLVHGVTGSVTIPSGVTTIGNSAFDSMSGLVSVTIPSSVTAIESYAFNKCTGLASVTIPDSVTTIGDRAFYNCSGLETASLPERFSGSLASNVFSGCSSALVVTYRTPTFTIENGTLEAVVLNGATSVTIPGSVTSIGAQAFRNCSTLTSVTIPSSVTNIHMYAFDGCSALKSFAVASGNTAYKSTSDGLLLTKSGKTLVHGVTGSVTIPSNVTSIGAGAFDSMSGLTSVTIPSGVTSIGAYAFNGCSGLKSVTIPSGVTTITPYAFSGCSGLTSVTIPSNVTTLGSYAFYNCIGLASVTIPSGVTSIGTYAFAGCRGLKSVTIPDSVTSIKNYAFCNCSGLRNVVVPDSVTTIGDYAFYNCSGLETASLPERFSGSLASNVFSGCSSALVVTYRIPTFTIENGTLKAVVLNGATSVTVPSTVKAIGEEAFKNLSALKSVTIPGSVTSIGKYAFYRCSGLTSVTIGNGVTSIGVEAFVGCSGLTSVTIPDSVTSIGDGAFTNCGGLTSVTIGNGVTSVGYGVFSGCIGLKSVTIPGSMTSIGQAMFYGCSELKSVTIPGSVTNIGMTAFSNCSGLTSVTIPDSVTSIGFQAFYACIGLSSVTIPDSVTSIVYGAFSGCRGLTSVTIPSSVTSIGDNAFYGCSGLTSVYVSHGDANRIKDLLVASGLDISGVNFIELAPPSFKVTFGKNGGTGGDDYVTCTYGKPMPTPRTAPKKSGYVFEGYWTTTGTGGVCYYDGAMKSVRNWDKTANTTLWAKWTKAVSVKVTFGKNGGTGGDAYVTATYGSAMPTPRKAPTLSGWTFAGYWDTLALDEKGSPKGKQYYDASMKSVRSWDKTAAATLWAKWTNRVTFGKNGGTGGDDYVTCTKGQPMPKRTMPTKPGYAFAGYWTTTGAGGVKYYNADGTSAHAWDKSGNVTLWAKWEKAVTVKVTLGKNGGTGGDNYVTCTTGKPMPTPRTAPKRTGWTFAGYWDTLAQDANGNPTGKQYYDANMKSVRNWDKTAAVTLWAKWTVKVKLGKNGGTGGDNEVVVTYNQPFPKKAMPTRTGYTFGGYFVSVSSKTGQCYNADGTGTSSMKWTTGGTPTIWALWTKTSSSLKLASPTPVVAQPPVTAAPEPIPAGLYSGMLADGSGMFYLTLDEPGLSRTAYLYIVSQDGIYEAECTAEESGGVLLLTTEDGVVYAFDPVAGTLGGI